MKKLMLMLALIFGAAEAPVQVIFAQQIHRIRRVPTDTRDWVNAYFPREIWEALWHEDYDDLDAAVENGWLVDIPNDPEGLGIQFQTSGDFPIAEAEEDIKLKHKLFRLAKPAAGLLFRLVELLREEEETNFRPLLLTSLVRPWQYQLKLIPCNPNADVKAQGVPPTHVFGLAFDITRAKLTVKRDQRLFRLLLRLRKEGKLIFFKEGEKQATYHVIALLQAREEFEADYYRLIQTAATALTLAGQQ